VFSVNSRIKWSYIGEEFKYYLDVTASSLLHEDSFAYDFFNNVVLPDTFNEVSSGAWTCDSKFKESSQLMELSIGSRNYNQVLTFLYVEEIENDCPPDSHSEDYNNDEYTELDGHLKFKKR